MEKAGFETQSYFSYLYYVYISAVWHEQIIAIEFSIIFIFESEIFM